MKKLTEMNNQEHYTYAKTRIPGGTQLTRARMDYAALLLRTTDRSVSSIGTEIGYGSESAFFKIFRRNFGMTPRQFRSLRK